MRKLSLLLALLVVALVAIWIKVPFLHTIFVRTTPTISISEPDSASGQPAIKVSVNGQGGSVNKITVVASQAEKQKTLLETDLSPAESSKELTIQLPSTADGFTDGKATISVNAFDSGFWSTKGSQSREILIDSHIPKLELLSLQHVVAQGGSELILLKAKDENLTGVGVTVDEISFPAFKLTEFDPFFAAYPDHYGVMIALPIEFDPDHGRIEAFATDAAGNRRKLALNFRISRSRQPDVTPKLSLPFLHRKLPELLPGYGKMAGVAVPSETQIENGTPDFLVENFKAINQKYRALLQDKLKGMLFGKVTEKRWKDDFLKPMSSATTSIFGERRAYSLDGKEAGGSVHYGLDLASVASDIVRSSNAGTVLFAGEFGIYGEAVLVDHGLGLSSLYGHLSSTSVQVGETVERGQELGRSGQTGLAGGDHLHFEYRLNNVPVTPIEWWDPKWVHDHVTGKIEGLKTSLQAVQ